MNARILKKIVSKKLGTIVSTKKVISVETMIIYPINKKR